MVALHVTGDVRLGELLAELTGGMPAQSVHAEILERAESRKDSRIDGVATDPAEFAAIWDSLQNGLRVPVTAWEEVVLPTILAFGGAAVGKSNLELATSYWLAAQAPDPLSALELPGAQRPPVHFHEPPIDAEVIHTPRPKPKSAAARRTRRRLLIAIGIAILVAVAVMWWQDAIPTSFLDPQSARPAGQAGATPSPSLTTSPTPGPQRTTAPPVSSMEAPMPTPTWTGPGPAVAPSAPQALAATNTTPAAIELTWQPPASSGTGGISHYVIQRDGVDAGWTAQTSATIGGLNPGTTYTFTVVAHNAAGLVSPPGGPINATTQALPQITPGQVTTAPLSPLGLGQSFSIVGAGWPCAPAQIRIYLENKLIATTTTSGDGSFSAEILVETEGPDVFVAAQTRDERVVLTSGSWEFEVKQMQVPGCSSVLSRTTEVEFQ